MPLAALASKLLTVPPSTGLCSSDAYNISGSLTSMPNTAVPLTLAGVSNRVTLLPTMRNWLGSLIDTFSGTGSCEAAAASWP